MQRPATVMDPLRTDGTEGGKMFSYTSISTSPTTLPLLYSSMVSMQMSCSGRGGGGEGDIDPAALVAGPSGDGTLAACSLDAVQSARRWRRGTGQQTRV
jgi:hypothetical protein